MGNGALAGLGCEFRELSGAVSEANLLDDNLVRCPCWILPIPQDRYEFDCARRIICVTCSLALIATSFTAGCAVAYTRKISSAKA